MFNQEKTIAELEKKVNELNQKLLDVTTELQKLKEVKESGEGTSSRAQMRDEDLPDVSSESRSHARNKALKRKVTGSYESRVKRSRN